MNATTVLRVARWVGWPLCGGTFVLSGADSLRNPAPRAQLVRDAGLPAPEALARADGAIMVVAGLGLATGLAPACGAAVLAGALVPTTVVGHRFWKETDQAARTAQLTHLVKNVAMIGGLVVIAADAFAAGRR